MWMTSEDVDKGIWVFKVYKAISKSPQLVSSQEELW